MSEMRRSHRNGLFIKGSLLAIFGGLVIISNQLGAAAASCAGANSQGYSYTGFVTNSFDYSGMGTLISDASVSLPLSTDHIVEYVDSVTKPEFPCDKTFGICWAQSGWGYGDVGGVHSGADQRPYSESYDYYGYTPYFDLSVGVHCCAQNDVSNTSTSWDGLYDNKNNPEFRSYFNNEVGSGNVVLGNAFLPAPAIEYAREDSTGEEYSGTGACPAVGQVTFALTEIQPYQTYYSWTATEAPGGLDPSSSTYPFLSKTEFTGFSYKGG